MLCVIVDIVFSDGKVSSYLHVGNIVYTVCNHFTDFSVIFILY